MLLMASFRDSRIADFARRHAAYRLLATLFEQSCHRSSGLHQLALLLRKPGARRRIRRNLPCEAPWLGGQSGHSPQ